PAQIQTIVQTEPQYRPEQLKLCTGGTLVSETGGICPDGTFVEYGGVCPDGSIVQQAGGLCSDGSVVIIEEEPLPTEGDTVQIVEEALPMEVETVQIVEEPLEVEIATAEIEENGGSTSSGSGIIQTGVNAIAAEAAISESGDSISSGTNVAVLEENWVDIPLDEEAPQESIDNRNTTEESFATSKNSLCIVSREPYDSLTPENLYTIRASIMEITNAKGKKGAGLIISDQFVLTSADLVTKDVNRYDLKTINGVHYTGTVFRINPNKNTALLLLDEKTLYTPLSLNLDLPEINKDTYMTLGLLDFESGEGYLDNNGKVSGYRYSEEKGAEIIVDTFVQTVTTGGALIDSHGTITGLSNSGKKLEDGPDLFIPIETALKSVGLEICGKAFGPEKEIPQITRPISNAIETNTGDKSPESMNKKERK
ncbi:MAG: trypsin-like peptidase domain-containing protein, partial [Alphaproteobacteria bacterium]